MKTAIRVLIYTSLTFAYLTLNAQVVYHEPTEIAGRPVKSVIWNEQKVFIVEREIALKVDPAVSNDQVSRLLADLDAELVRTFNVLGWGLIRLPESVDEITAIGELKKSTIVLYAEPNMVYRAGIVPNDTHFTKQWALSNTGQSPPGGTIGADISATKAWDITTGRPDVVIAILDSGIPLENGQLSHTDLNDPERVILGPDYIGDGEGVRDRSGHGTHVAGIAAAETNNAEGVAGISWNSKILIIQVFDAGGFSTNESISNGILYAAHYSDSTGNNVVINYSGGGPESQQIANAVQETINKNVIIVAAAMNDCGDTVSFPASHPSVIAVSATDHNDEIAEYSNVGPEIDISAPGGQGNTDYCQTGVVYYSSDNIFSTTPNYSFIINDFNPEVSLNYGYLWGTSMATPHVAGTAALIWSINGTLSSSVVRTILRNTADKIPGMGGQNFTNEYGYGRLNAYEAVKYTIENYGGWIGGDGKTIVFHEDITIMSGKTLHILAGTEFVNNGNLTIESGAELVFGSGVIVKMGGGKVITVNGKLIAEGTSSNRITFRGTSTSPGSWNGIVLNGAEGSSITHTDILHAWEAIKIENTHSVFLNNVNIEKYVYRGIDIYNSSPGIASATLDGTEAAAACASISLRFAGGSGGSFIGGAVKNTADGNSIVITGGSSPIIQYNHILDNAYEGIRVISNGSAIPEILDNTIRNSYSWTDGVYVYNSSALLRQNIIENNDDGVFATSYSTVRSGYPTDSGGYFLQGRNIIRNNATGLRTGSNSTALFGVYTNEMDNYGMMNQLYNNSNLNALNGSGSIIYAEGNWWGSDPPDWNKISAGVSVIPWMKHDDEYPPTGGLNGNGGALAKSSSNDSLEEILTEGMTDNERKIFLNALTAFVKGEYKESKDWYHKLLSKTDNPYVQTRALVGLYNIFRITLDDSLLNTVLTYREKTNEAGIVAGEILYSMYAAVERYDDSRRVAETLAQRYPYSGTEMHALIHLAALRGYTRDMEEVSQNAQSALSRKYGSIIDKGLLNALGVVSEGSEFLAEGDAELNEEQVLFSLSNYPNPFNPATVIEFSLPVDGMVNLNVYDILGRKVTTLVDDFREAGMYRVEFSAGYLPSGIYFTRLEAGGQSLIHRMLLVK